MSYLAEREKKFILDNRNRLFLDAIAKRLDRSVETVRSYLRAFDRNARRQTEERAKRVYLAGMDAWADRLPCEEPSQYRGSMAERMMWRAGWHDADIQAGNSVIAGRL